MSGACRCGCGRPVAPDEQRRRQLAWMNAVAEDGTAGVLAERAAANEALTMLEDAIRTWGCVDVLGEAGAWRERWDIATDRASRAGLLSSGDPESRRLQLDEMNRRYEITGRSVTLWQMDMRPDGRAGYVAANPTAREEDVLERAVGFARRKLPAYIAKQVPRPVKVYWFTERANPYITPAFWATPHLRGATVNHPQDGTMRVRVGQGDDTLVETVAHELFHLGQVRWASDEHRAEQERDAHEFGIRSLADWQANEAARGGVADLAMHRRRVR